MWPSSAGWRIGSGHDNAGGCGPHRTLCWRARQLRQGATEDGEATDSVSCRVDDPQCPAIGGEARVLGSGCAAYGRSLGEAERAAWRDRELEIEPEGVFTVNRC
jgi:hypothetical protein